MPKDGSLCNPYSRLEEATSHCNSGDVGIVSGHYENAGIQFSLNKKIPLKALNGKVYIRVILPE